MKQTFLHAKLKLHPKEETSKMYLAGNVFQSVVPN